MPTHIYYAANLEAINGDKIGTYPKGRITIAVDDDNLVVKINMQNTPANTEHWQHIHGFLDDRDAQVAGKYQDSNKDGYIDLPETAETSGDTLIPLNDHPENLKIPTNTYPIADAVGNYSYEKTIPLDKLHTQFSELYNDSGLQLDKRVVYIHGVPQSMELPDTVAGTVGDFDPHTTLPIAGGKLEQVDHL